MLRVTTPAWRRGRAAWHALVLHAFCSEHRLVFCVDMLLVAKLIRQIPLGSFSNKVHHCHLELLVVCFLCSIPSFCARSLCLLLKCWVRMSFQNPSYTHPQNSAPLCAPFKDSRPEPGCKCPGKSLNTPTLSTPHWPLDVLHMVIPGTPRFVGSKRDHITSQPYESAPSGLPDGTFNGTYPVCLEAVCSPVFSA